MTDTTHDIVDTALAPASFTTLVASVTAARLVETLKGDGRFTVVAPVRRYLRGAAGWHRR